MCNRVTIDSKGFVNRQKTKQRHKPKKEHETEPHEILFNSVKPKNPKSSGHGLEVLGVYKTARIMRAGTKENRQSFNNGEYKHTDEKPQEPRDDRCHPAIKKGF